MTKFKGLAKVGVVLSILAGAMLAAPAMAQQSPAGKNRIINLYDAFGPGSKVTVQKDWGYSALIEYEGKRILFDAGNNADVLQKNVEALGIDLTQLDFAVLSHAHADHLSGFDYVFSVNPKLKLYVPYDRHVLGGNTSLSTQGPEAGADQQVSPDERYYAGPKATQILPTTRWWKKDVEFISEDKVIAPGLRLVFTKSPFLGDVNSYPPNENAPKITPLNEISLSIASPKGQILIVGCSHSGVENIIKATRERTGTDVYTVVGGFHLFPYPKVYTDQLARTIKDDLKVQRVSPAHCTGHLGFLSFRKVFGDQYLQAGLGTIVTID